MDLIDELLQLSRKKYTILGFLMGHSSLNSKGYEIRWRTNIFQDGSFTNNRTLPLLSTFEWLATYLLQWCIKGISLNSARSPAAKLIY